MEFGLVRAVAFVVCGLLALVAPALAAVPVPQPACGLASHCTNCGPSFNGPGVITYNLGPAVHNLTIYNGSDYELPLRSVHLLWFMNVCGYTVSHCKGAEGIVYFQSDLDPNNCHYVATGSQPSTWAWLNPNDASAGVSQTYVDGDFAGCTNNQLRQVTINYQCTQLDWFVILDASETPVGSCKYVMDVATEWACPSFVPDPVPVQPGGGGGGISGGSVFLIIFFVGGGVYVIGGMLYRRYRTIDPATGLPPNTVSGLCPNRDLWVGLAALVRDGCRFTYRRSLRLCGQTASGDHPYEDIGAPSTTMQGMSHDALGNSLASDPFANSNAQSSGAEGRSSMTAVAIAGAAARDAAAKSVSAAAPPPMSPYDAH